MNTTFFPTGSGTPPAIAVDMFDVTDFYLCAVRRDDQTAECWGSRNFRWNVPVLSVSTGYLPEPDVALSDLAVGADHACGVRRDNGQLLCRGRNDSGAATPPTAIAFADVTAGADYGCALREAMCWGSNTHRQAVPPAGLAFERIDASERSTCAVRADNHHRSCWGEVAHGP